MISGEIFEKRLHPFLDNELDEAGVKQIEEYLQSNPDERRRVAAMRELLDDLRLLADVPLPEGFHENAYAKIRAGGVNVKSDRIIWRSVVAAAAAFVVLCVGAVAIDRYIPADILEPGLNVTYRSEDRLESVLDEDADYGGLFLADTYSIEEAIPQSEQIGDYPGGGTFKGETGDLQAKINSPLNTGVISEIADDSSLNAQELAASRGLKIIRSADASVETYEFDDMMTRLSDNVAAISGYFENSSVTGDPAKAEGYKNRTASLTIRIPRDSFDAFIEWIKSAEGVSSISESNKDITAQYIDTQTRLETLHNQYSRLEELNQKAATVTQLIEIEREMQNVLYNIESYTGDLKYWDMQVEYATINVFVRELSPINRVAPANESLGDRMVAAFYKTVNGFVGFLENTVIWLISVIPVLFVAIPVLAVILAGVFRHRRKSKQD